MPHEYIVRSRSTANNSLKFLAINSALNVQKLDIHSNSNISTFKIHLESDSERNALLSDQNILSVEENCKFHLHSTASNDPGLNKQWYHDVIRLHQAWDIKHESSIVVAIPDTGIQIDHPDLSENIWVNKKELNGLPGIDDDHNGFIDDIYGWSQADKTNDIAPGNYFNSDHGTHIAGIIGAVGDNSIGIAGTSWRIKIMALRPFSKTQESATTADLIESIYYAVNNGAKIINCSWGSGHQASLAELDAYAYAEKNGVLVVASAGNDHIDATEITPASISTVLAIGSVNSDFDFSTFSNFGSSVPLLAPGGDAIDSFGFGKEEWIYSTSTNSSYTEKRGTSFSAPLVSGVAALVKSFLPNIRPKELRRLLVESSTKVTYKKNGVEQSYGILNAERSLSLARELSLVDSFCSENCAFSSGYLSIKTKTSAFGGGCQMNLRSTENPRVGEPSPWDLALLFSSLSPKLISYLARRKRLRKRR